MIRKTRRRWIAARINKLLWEKKLAKKSAKIAQTIFNLTRIRLYVNQTCVSSINMEVILQVTALIVKTTMSETTRGSNANNLYVLQAKSLKETDLAHHVIKTADQITIKLPALRTFATLHSKLLDKMVIAIMTQLPQVPQFQFNIIWFLIEIFN